ncbi:coumaroyl-CoA:anthocyanidin 3-O-glucoside-6''-O-coumaroyltransferase 1-like [Glycine max]|uniref:coumaroyl-CoA:anthocyanidin 3-O-glucoside-6''-O-coumaroyltransferase 1-like n=1 Tax=Glycine max TaxID=3847 RepID=UPI000E21BA51|nr:coumaroyl-CoA:anthocyanidin 3-O-glucoside-6''-O-coumaroyltransferase 1-like [Glycine max]|eukprot:XP_025982697.1 coumaroyl-CoA:anthocyanidin 3-O-glucoside-6''-O-coumaroyltransferase 1-like [Glycine max]
MTVQVTVFDNNGHAIADGRAFHHFMKFWASVCGSNGDKAFSLQSHLALPLHHREMVEDSNGLRSTCPIYDAPSNSDMVKSKDPDTEVTDPKDDDSYCLTFLADCRNRSKLSVPSTYFGNCLTICHVELQKEKLVGENGILEAVSAIGGEVRGLRGDPLKGFEWIVSGRRRRELGRQSQHVMIIAGSPKLNVYETDFGWGRPKMSEILHADDAGAMCLSDCRNQERGGIEVGLALSAIQMKKFNAILDEQLGDIDIVVPHRILNTI